MLLSKVCRIDCTKIKRDYFIVAMQIKKPAYLAASGLNPFPRGVEETIHHTAPHKNVLIFFGYKEHS
jgi:hypothetical protein